MDADGPVARLLVAIYMHADREGLECVACDADLAAASGLPAGVVPGVLDELERAGLVAILMVPPHRVNPGRKVVLMDHAIAAWYVAETRRSLAAGVVAPG